MSASVPFRAFGLLALLALSACGGGPRGDWREAFGRTTPNPVVLTPAQPLAIPATLELPPPLRVQAAGP